MSNKPASGQPVVIGRSFVAIIATCMGMTALSIDLMLPAFADMREEFGLASDSTEVSRLITVFFLGLAVGQFFYGPLSDRFGRKRPLYVGLTIYVLSATAASFQTTLTGVIICRFLWGLGAAGSRSLALAMVRDTMEGDRMARTMSHVMAIFVLVPVFAPGIGSIAMAVAPWRVVFWLPAAAAVVLGLVITKLPETLPPERRRAVSPKALGEAFSVVMHTRQTVAYGLAATTLFGIISGYIGTSEIIIDEVFGQADRFPVIFGVIACMFGFAALLTGRIVMRIGLARLLRLDAVFVMAVSGGFAVLALSTGGRPPLWAFIVGMTLLLAGVTSLTPNCNTAAMTPVPHVAGMAAALLGTVSTGGGALLGAMLDRSFDGTITPFAIGTFLFACAAGACIFLFAGPPLRVAREDAASSATLSVTIGDAALPGEPA